MTTSEQVRMAAGIMAVGALLLVRARRGARAIDYAGKSVVIFGGSRGLGLVIARELAREGARLTLLARDLDELERARASVEEHGGEVAAITCDIRQRSQVEAAIEQIISHYGRIDVLINDAGIIQVGPVQHMSVSDFEDAMATHFWGPLFAILAALPHMRHTGDRRIVNISSIGGKVAVPHLVPYSASKFALTGLSEGLGVELASEGFRVTTVCPGLMRTGSTYNAQFKGQHRQEFAWFHLFDSIPGLSIDARRAARQVIEACRHGDAELVITLPARAAILLNAAFPGVVSSALALTNALMPSATDESGNQMRAGWQSASAAVPSSITKLADRATAENNELP